MESPSLRTLLDHSLGAARIAEPRVQGKPSTSGRRPDDAGAKRSRAIGGPSVSDDEATAEATRWPSK
jgi:hypothetical protein